MISPCLENFSSGSPSCLDIDQSVRLFRVTRAVSVFDQKSWVCHLIHGDIGLKSDCMVSKANQGTYWPHDIKQVFSWNGSVMNMLCVTFVRNIIVPDSCFLNKYLENQTTMTQKHCDRHLRKHLASNRIFIRKHSSAHSNITGWQMPPEKGGV